jgi:putative acetyltransferase
MIIRQIRDADVDDTSNLIIHCLNKINRLHYSDKVIDEIIAKNTPENIKNDMQDELIVVADLYGKIIGTARVQTEKKKNYFGSVFVHPDYINQGIGRELLNNLEELLSRQGTEKVIILSSVNAVEFYEKQGYERTKLVNDTLFGKSYKMVKYLNKNKTREKE